MIYYYTVMPKKLVKKYPKNKLSPNMKKAVDKEITKVIKRKVEPKGFDSTASNVLIGNGASMYIQPLLPIAQGTDINKRIGNKIKAMSLYLRSIFTGALNSSTVGPFSTSIRMLLIQDNTDSGVIPVANDIFVDGTNTVSHMNWENSVIDRRFKVLFDKLFQLGKSDNSSGTATSVITYVSNTYVALTKYIKLSRVAPTCYSGANNTDYSKGQIFLVCLADTNTDRPTMNYSVRIKYQDM